MVLRYKQSASAPAHLILTHIEKYSGIAVLPWKPPEYTTSSHPILHLSPRALLCTPYTRVLTITPLFILDNILITRGHDTSTCPPPPLSLAPCEVRANPFDPHHWAVSNGLDCSEIHLDHLIPSKSPRHWAHTIVSVQAEQGEWAATQKRTLDSPLPTVALHLSAAQAGQRSAPPAQRPCHTHTNLILPPSPVPLPPQHNRIYQQISSTNFRHPHDKFRNRASLTRRFPTPLPNNLPTAPTTPPHNPRHTLPSTHE